MPLTAEGRSRVCTDRCRLTVFVIVVVMLSSCILLNQILIVQQTVMDKMLHGRVWRPLDTQPKPSDKH